MSWQIFQKWFNAQPWDGVEYFEGNHGEKFWIYWRNNEEDIANLRVLYRGHHIGHVIAEEKKHRLIIHDISVLKRYRKRGVGKGMMQEIVQWAGDNDFQEIYGFISPDEDTTLEYLQEWYRFQGFDVYEAKPGIFHILLKL
jgi:GNAT superfamily N-acetyltransferase